MYSTLQSFLADLESRGELHRVREPVDPLLQIAAIADRHSAAAAPTASRWASRTDPHYAHLGGKALLFEDVAGCEFPLAINVFGSYHRMELALGCAETGGFEAIAARIGELAQPQPPRSAGELLGKAKAFLPLLRIGPRRLRTGRCQEVVRRTSAGEVDLTRLPLIKCWPLDGDPAAVGAPIGAEEAGTAKGQGRYITLAGMHTIDARDVDAAKPASHNIGVYRAQLVDATHLAMHWHMHHDGAAHWRSWKAAGRPMPIAISFGGESVLPYAGTSPLPPGISELLMAGFLNGRGIPLVRAKTVPLWVPANSELVIEGYVSTECGFIDYDPGVEPLGPGAVFEGPFGDHTGFYSLPDRYPLVDVTAITHAREAVFPATVVGLPPQEDYYLGKATERLFQPLLRVLIPDLHDYHLPRFGCFHNCAFIAIDKSYPLQARRVMHAVWGAGQMAWTKLVVVVDASVNVHDENEVFAAVARNCHFGRDLELVNGPLDILDHAAPRLGAGHKLGIDATAKRRGEEVNGVPIDGQFQESVDAERLRQLVPALGGRIVRGHLPAVGAGRALFLAVDKDQSGQGAAAIEQVWDALERPDDRGLGGGDFVIAVDGDIDVTDTERVLFLACANCDPGRDLLQRGARLGFDATTKRPGDERNGHAVRPYPPMIRMDESVIRAINANAAAYGLT